MLPRKKFQPQHPFFCMHRSLLVVQELLIFPEQSSGLQSLLLLHGVGCLSSCSGIAGSDSGYLNCSSYHSGPIYHKGNKHLSLSCIPQNVSSYILCIGDNYCCYPHCSGCSSFEDNSFVVLGWKHSPSFCSFRTVWNSRQNYWSSPLNKIPGSGWAVTASPHLFLLSWL